MEDAEKLREEITRLTRQYTRLRHRASLPGSQRADSEFAPGVTSIPYAGRVFDADEVEAAVASSLDFWLTLGAEGDAFEKELATYLGIKRSILANSGSSANLLAFSALTSVKLPPERRVRRGDEVITAAAGFPTTVAPIVQNGAVPVFLDSDPLTSNIDVRQLEEAYTPGKTKAVMMAHTLGNPFDIGAVTDFCRRHNLWLVEDNCDALGAEYLKGTNDLSTEDTGGTEMKSRREGPGPQVIAPSVSSMDAKPCYGLTGTFGDLSTQSFYPPHHLTLGEGGAVNIVRNMQLKVLVESFRDWGRDCWCASGKDDTCGKRFGWRLGELPEGYDHKYIYSHLGYNMKPLDLQAAIGRAQLKKLPAFIQARRENWETLRQSLAPLEEYFDFMQPTPRSRPSWFGFMLLRKADAPFTRTGLARFLESRKIGCRMLFGGNLVRQPAFMQLAQERPGAFRVIGDLPGADRLMNESLFVGVYPGLTRAMLDYIAESIHDFVKTK